MDVQRGPFQRQKKMRLDVFERRILRKFCGPVEEEGVWRMRDNYELYELRKERDIAVT
jgi:hypothetical protein